MIHAESVRNIGFMAINPSNFVFVSFYFFNFLYFLFSLFFRSVGKKGNKQKIKNKKNKTKGGGELQEIYTEYNFSIA